MRTVGINDGKVFWVLTYTGRSDDRLPLVEEVENDIKKLREELEIVSPLL